MASNTEYLHVFAQQQWHDEAYIIGNRRALENLRTTIDQALATGHSTVVAFTNDGEGYDAHVTLLSDEQVNKLAVPYTDEFAREGSESALWPWSEEITSPNVDTAILPTVLMPLCRGRATSPFYLKDPCACMACTPVTRCIDDPCSVCDGPTEKHCVLPSIDDAAQGGH